ncbi:hypothetical protein [Carboxylicivirga taeanensis]|uniref:hypothetical protein n=1 Tax=Carboxylicivirga taeanensis TaxID=1416875 RepID=UPI003F6DCC8C
MKIKALQRAEINASRWNACVNASANGSVFVHTWFLDIVCPGWEAIVFNDYEALMVLPVKSKLGFKCVYSPALIPYTGVINRVPVDHQVVWSMLRAVPYLNVHLIFNPHNALEPDYVKGWAVRKYAVLDMITDIHRIESDFRGDVLEWVELYTRKKLTVIRALNVADYIEYAKRLGNENSKELTDLQQLLSFALTYKSAGLYAAYNEFNQMVAGAFFLKASNTLTLIHCASDDREYGGVKAIIYHMINNNWGANLTLEFPFYSDTVGSCFTSKEHVCLVYKKGLSKWIDL